MSSLPVPLSPVTRTLALLGPTWATSSRTACIFGSLDTMWLKRVALAQPVAQAPRLLDEPRLLHRPLDDRAERLGVERLDEVVLGALLHRVDGARDRAERRHDDEDRARRRRPRLLHERDAVEPRHLQVRQDDVGRELLELAERLEAVGRGLGRVALFAEDLAERGPRVRFVVDDEDSTAVRHVAARHPSAAAAASREIEA